MEDFLFFNRANLAGPSFSSQYGSKVSQEPPPVGWLKINLDIAHKRKCFVLAIVVRADCEKLLFLSSKLDCFVSTFDVEVGALEWASVHAANCGWSIIVWEVDAMEVVKDVLARGG